RERAGLKGGGPEAVITTMGVFRFEPDTKEMYLESCHPGVSVEQIKASISWDLKISPDIKETEPPTEEQVEIMRILDPYGVYLGAGRQAMSDKAKGFDFYMEVLENSYSRLSRLFGEKGI
ncbi:MAG: glutaconate CoA-transferase, partial [Clostridia bacterium]|nr:glutaconate CoA-transferase [Clostridia bacterium]